MAVSEFTRQVCRRICIERGVEMEIARLDAKLAMMLDHGTLTPSEASRDAERKAESARMFAAGRSDDALLDGIEHREMPR